MAAGEACAEVAACGTENHDGAASHVFASVVTDAFHHEGGAAVAYAKTFASASRHEHLARGGAETGDIACNHVLMRIKGDARFRTHDHTAAGQALACVVVDFAVYADGFAAWDERADGLAARTVEGHVDGVVRQTFLAVALGDLVADHGAKRTVHVADWHLDAHRLLLLKGWLRKLDELVVERLVEFVVLLDGLMQDGSRNRSRLHEHVAQIDAIGLPTLDRFVLVEAFDMADGLLQGAEAKLCEQFADFLGDEHEEVDDVLRLALEACAQFGILGGDALRAGVLLAGTHHDAAFDDQRRGGEAKLLGTKQGCDHHVAAGLELAIALHGDTRTQAVEHERLLGFGQADLPWGASVFDSVERSRAGATVVTGNQHHVGMALGNAGRDGADAELGDELDVDAGLRIRHLRIVDQLLQILDGIDVMVRRRRDELDARGRVTDLGDPRRDLGSRKVAAFARLGALGELDLQIGGMYQVVASHAEARRCDLLDLAVAQRIVDAVFGFPAFAGVGTCADGVHGDGEGLVRLLGDRSVAHGAGGETLDDLAGRLNLADVDRFAIGLELHQATQRHQTVGGVVDVRRILLEHVVIAALGGLLQQEDGLRIVEVVLAGAAPLVFAAGAQVAVRTGGPLRRVGDAVTNGDLFGQLVESDAADAGGGTGEVFVDDVLIQADGFEQLRATVAHDGGNAHLGHDLEHASGQRVGQVLHRGFGIDVEIALA